MQCAITNEDIQRIMSQIDVNNNNTIDYSEFVAATLNRKLFLEDQRLKMCFMLFDHDQNGKISLDEFRILFEKNVQVDQKLWQ